MARNTVGFHGTVLARVFDGSGDAAWGVGSWSPEPLYGASGLRGSTLHFQVRWAQRVYIFLLFLSHPVIIDSQHNLSPSAMARDVPELCWALSQGIHLSLDLSYAAYRANTSWLAVVSNCQRVLLSRFTDYTGTFSVFFVFCL